MKAKAYVYLFFAFLLGLVGSTMLKLSDGFTVLVPTIIFAVSYCLAFYLFSLALRVIPLYLGYAIWSALSVIGNTAVSVLFFQDSFHTLKFLAVCLIILGVILIQKQNVQQPEEACF